MVYANERKIQRCKQALQSVKIVGLVERIDNRPSQLSSISERFYFKLINEKH